VRGPEHGSHVTFVIATYRRADALRCTLRSLLLQAHANWTALVIGDCCTEETAEAVRSLREPRIRHYNLPRRCGEQSGPNTAGLHLAEGDFVSFLNQDDLLLGDHLVRAIGELDTRGADFYVGKFANATRLAVSSSGAQIPVSTCILPESEDLGLLVTRTQCFDPSSFWVIRTGYARAVGAWRPAGTLWRTPLDDWLLRAWRLGGTFCFGSVVTGIRIWTHNLRTQGPLYAHASPENEYMVARMEGESADATRAFIGQQIEETRRAEPAPLAPGPVSFADAWRARARRLYPRGLYLKLGVDPVSLAGRIRRRPRGAGFDRVSRKRTGEPLPVQPTIQDFLLDPEAHRVA
jgi:Glycosyl transferase family 2